MIKFIKDFLASVFPQRCAYCTEAIPSDALVCSQCEKELPRINGTICHKCGRAKDDCSCKNAEMYYNGICAPFYFVDNVRKGVHFFKFRNYPQNADAYSSEMAKTIKERYSHITFDFITEVPMTEKAIEDRGYNQCSLLAERISKITGIKYKPGVLKKLYGTDKQHDISFYLRKGNLTGVYDVVNPEEVRGKTVLLVDDISTTGETLNECAKMLWLYDAKEIYCIAVALTKPNKNNK